MITFKELNPKGCPLTADQTANLFILLKRINIIREKWAQPMIVTSGFRSLEDHKRIYAQKKQGPNFRIPMNSKHLSGQAVDIADAHGHLKEWIARNPGILEQAQLWCEDFASTPTWLHFQCVPPKSGKRFFKP